MLITQGKISTKEITSIEGYISLLVNYFIKYDNFDISGPTTRHEKIVEFKRYYEIDFDENLCKNPNVPKTLLRKENESYDIYLGRISDFLKDLDDENVIKILESIDSSEQKYQPVVSLLQNIIN